MKEIFLVTAFGGQWDDSWERVVRACMTEVGAQTLIDNYVRWLKEIRETEVPESLADHNVDYEDEEDVLRHDIAQDEFRLQVLLDMGVPEEDHDWLFENWDFSYCCDEPFYRIDSVMLQ